MSRSAGGANVLEMTNALRSPAVSRPPRVLRAVSRAAVTTALVAAATVVGFSLSSSHGRTVEAAGEAIGAGGEYHAINPVRILDTREPSLDVPPLGRKPFTTNGSDGLFNVSVVGKAGLQGFADGNGDCADDNVLAVAVNITVVNPGSVGYLEAFGKGESQSPTSILNFKPGEFVANTAILRPGCDGELSIRLAPGASASADVLVDIFGWFSSSTFGTRGARLEPSGPGRIFDSRENAFESVSFAGGEQRQIDIRGATTFDTGALVVPNDPNVVGVLVNVTGVNADADSAPTFVSLLPAQAAGDPTTSNLNLRRGQVRSNLAIGPDGAAAARRQAGGEQPRLRARRVRAGAGGALHGRPQRRGVGHAHALRGAPAGVSFARAALHLGGLWALAFAQPLFDLLGRNAQFFVARGSTAGDILLLAFGYVLLPPLLGALLVWGLGRIRPAAGWWAMLVLVALIVAGLLLPPAGDALGGSPLALPVALALGAGAAALYARFAGVRSFATVLSPAPLIVLLLFLVFSPVRGLLFPDEASGAVGGPARSSTPIVHVVLDELPQATLANSDGEIDAELFPNFARLARESTWYRNATTVDDLTTEAVPAQLTGMMPRQGRIPTTRDHPRSLFTLFERSHDLTVVEPITDLCPDRLCADVRPGTADRLESLGSDLEVVVQHLLLPEDMRDGLPAIDRVWEGFETQSVVGNGELRGGSNLRRDVLDRLAADDATAGFERAIASLEGNGSRPPLLFLHSTLPHGGWRYLPDGRQYPVEGLEYIGLASEGWIGPQWQVDQGFQRHVLQVQYTDTLVGRLLDALRARGLYDDAVVVVAADHGASFVTGKPRRPATRDNVGAIAPVPLFVKLPGQRRGRVDDRAVRTVGRAADDRGGRGRADPVADRRAARLGASRRSRARGSTCRTRASRRCPSRSATCSASAPSARRSRRGCCATGCTGWGRGRICWGAGSRRRRVRGASTSTPRSPVLPSFIAGDAGPLRPGAELAVAVNGRVEATTRVYRDDGRSRYAALVPPSSLREGANDVAVVPAP